MSSLAIEVEDIAKEYRIGHINAPYRTLRDSLVDGFAAPFRRAASLLRGQAYGAAGLSESFWALKGISFEVQYGEVIGIIGRNGAGKSTLLKVLSRITEPSRGEARLYGRVGSLLEVGTGFHPELTGRENVFLNGAILGMKRTEIARKFDEMVAFAEVEQFIDTPVKHYSSGMQVRLAFAVAAHLEPEILIVDEVLAVGDASFQRKCMSKMHDVGSKGRTVLFVSHSMPAITRLCERTILLDKGEIIDDGPSHRVVGKYLRSGLGTTAARVWEAGERPGNDIVRLIGVRARNEAGETVEALDIRQAVGIEMEYEVLKPGYSFLPHFTLHNADGILVFVAIDQDPAWRGRARPPGRYISTGWIPGNFLAEGTILIGPTMRTIEPDLLHFNEADSIAFQVVDAPGGDTARGDYTKPIPGVIRPLLKWETDYRGEHDQAASVMLAEESQLS
jgi:lipopolysaccharide transport system ATP-binding protein